MIVAIRELPLQNKIIALLAEFFKELNCYIKTAAMKRYFLLLVSQWSIVLFSSLSPGQALLEEEEPPENYQFQVFLEEEEALSKVFAGCDRVESEFITLTPEGLEYFKGLLKRPDIETTFQVYIGKKGGVADRYAIITEEMGCFHPITWILSTDTEGKIRDIAVMIYRESRGQEVSRRRFLQQFEGKSLKDPLSTNKDIIRITGATVSVQAVCRGVKKMLAFINEFYIKEKPISATLARRLTPEEAGASRSLRKQLFTTARVIEGIKAVLAAEADNEREFFFVANKIFNEMERVERLFKKELQALNSKAGKAVFPVNKEVFDLIKRCYHYGMATEGTFDVTVSPLLEYWGIYRGKRKEAVKEDKLKTILHAASYRNIKTDDRHGAISFSHKQTKVDLGPVVRGYAVDKAMELVQQSGITSVCINYGSVTRMLGPPSGKDFWKVGIPHPEKGDSVIGSLHLVNQGVTFVADYSQYSAVQDKFYTHLINPGEGRPVKNEIIAAMAVAATAEEAGVLATVLFIKGPEGMQKFLPVFSHAEWILLYEKPQSSIEFHQSSGIRGKFVKGEEKIFRYGRGAGCSFSP
ncbi:MAG: FAD:protein FMN transferase [Candidatus Brocadia sp.]|jgi:thiamine biosynthesis lipoprotein ApbE